MASRKPDRAKISAYFRYQTMIDHPWWGWIVSVLQLFLVCGVFPYWLYDKPWEGLQELSVRLVEAVIIATCVFAITATIRFVLLQLHKAVVRLHRRTRLKRLEADVVDIIKTDYKRALRQIVHRAGIKARDLRSIGSYYNDPLESRLFEPDELRRFLGLIKDESLRMVTPWGPEPDFAATTEDRLKGTGLFRGYFMPMRLACLFFTEQEVIIGDTKFDSRSGDMQTRITRLPRASFKGLATETHTDRQTLDRNRLLNWLASYQFLPSEEKAIARALRRHERLISDAPHIHHQIDPPYVLAQRTRMLVLDSGSNQTFTIPMRMTHALVRSASANNRDALPEIGKRDATSTNGRYLEYRTGGAFLLNLIASALVIGGAYTMLNQASLLPQSTFQALADRTIPLISQNGEVKPTIDDRKILPAAQQPQVSQYGEWVFACANRPTSLRSAPAWRSELQVDIDTLQPLLIRDIPTTNTTKPPSDWMEVEVEIDGKTYRGYLASTYVDAQPAGATPVCR